MLSLTHGIASLRSRFQNRFGYVSSVCKFGEHYSRGTS
jgi:hypothetical protein